MAHPSTIARLTRETRLARREIRQGHFQRSMALVTGFSAIVSGFDAYVQHERGAFSHWLMWTPIGLTPPTVAASLAALVSERAARRVLPPLAAATLADGVVGFVFHLRGIQQMPGGLSIGQYNVVMGPPVFAPLLMCSVGVAGLLTGYLRRERLNVRQPAAPVAAPTLRAAIGHGEFQRVMAITAAGFAALAGGEAYFEHLRGSYNRRLMWTPVWVTPPMAAAAAGAALSPRIARDVLPLASVVTFVDGMVGFGLHLRGIQQMPGGFANLHFNVMMGPPLFAPLLFSAVGLLGGIASLLRRRGA